MDETVHKDFHGAMSFGLAFLEREYGLEGMTEFLARLAGSVYKDLVEHLRARGLDALEEHWRRVFDLEQAKIEMTMEGETLVLRVLECPAVHHMKGHEYAIAPHFCEHTRIVNDAICHAAGYRASVEYDQGAGRCVQRFWRGVA